MERQRAVVDAREAFLRAEQRVLEHYGLAATPRFLELTDPPLRTRVLESGDGPPVLLVHGGGDFASQWTPLMAKLPGWRSLAVDRPGCGLTDPFDYRGTDLRRHAVAFLGSLLDGLGVERLPIVANSIGGLWSLYFALEHPERVSSLALLGCPALFPGTGAPLWLRLLTVGAVRGVATRLGGPSPAALRRFAARMLGPETAASMTEAEIESMRLAQRIPGAFDSLGTMLGSVLTLRGPRPGARIRAEELRRLSMPTLLIWGRDEPFGDVGIAERGVALLPHGKLEVVEGGHHPWRSEPERCGALLSGFLGTVDA